MSFQLSNSWGGTVSTVNFSERWMRDGLQVADTAGGVVSLGIDMTECSSIMNRLKSAGIPVTYASLIVSATAQVLAKHPRLQTLTVSNRKLSGGRIDICLSVGSNEILTPVVIIENADKKSFGEIGIDIKAKVPVARAEAERLMKLLRRWGWLVPFAVLRRWILKSLLGQLWYRRAMSGLFQVTILPGVDAAVALIFNTAAVLAVGAIAERPKVVGGEVVVRRTGVFTCSIDHKQWNGESAALFLSELRTILEQHAEALLSHRPASIGASA